MIQLEKVSLYVGMAVVGIGGLVHYLSLQNDVNNIKDNTIIIDSSIESNKKSIMELKSQFGSIDTNIENTKNRIEYIQERVDEQQNKIEESMLVTHKLLTKIAEKQ